MPSDRSLLLDVFFLKQVHAEDKIEDFYNEQHICPYFEGLEPTSVIFLLQFFCL